MLRYLSFLITILLSIPALSSADIIPLVDGWKFHRGFQAPENEIIDISLPHTWNADDALSGDKDYFRGLCNYLRVLPAGLRSEGNRVFLRVGCAQTVADIFVNSKFVSQHRGGYTAFVTEITDFLNPNKESRLEIRVNNAPTMDIAPVCGDFNFYGGLPRGVQLIVTGPVCIAPDFYASDGVFFSQRNVSSDRAEIDVKVMISAPDSIDLNGYEVKVALSDSSGVVASSSSPLCADATEITLPLVVEKPVLWDGPQNPHLYAGSVNLLKDGQPVDSRIITIGLRYFEVDADKGFFLNGRPYRLNGVNRHEETADGASAMTPEEHLKDISLIKELGCNAVRLSHYPQSPEFVELLDKNGLLAWCEIPFVNVYVNNPRYDENLVQQLKEMIYQYYNHPSVFGWGLFNEINSGWLDRPSKMVVTLDSIAHAIDPERLTMGASNQNDDFNDFTDIIAFNKYFGWYDGNPSDFGGWLDNEKSLHPRRKIGLSEYGAGGSVAQHSDSLVRPNPAGSWHPEEWQTFFHINAYRQIARRDFVWCNFIWCMFDFGSATRNEGDTPGRNDKGLVTIDRSTKKDAFFFYKANWNTTDPFIHIAGKRNPGLLSDSSIMAFTNDGDAELIINGVSYGVKSPDEVNVLSWDGLILSPGENLIEVITAHSSDSFSLFIP